MGSPPQIQYPNLDTVEPKELQEAIKTAYDNLFYLRGKVDTPPAPAPVAAAVPSSYKFKDDDIPDGDKDGVNKVFRLKVTPSPPESLMYFVGTDFYAQIVQGVGDYKLSGNQVIFTAAPPAGVHRYWCRY